MSRKLLAAASTAVLVGVVFVGVTASAAPPDPEVKVREQNLDTRGFIKVHEQGIAAVDINPTFSQVFQRTVLVRVNAGEAQFKAILDVPAGKRLVVQQVSAYLQGNVLNDDSDVTLVFSTISPLGNTIHGVPLQEVAGLGAWSATAPVTTYAQGARSLWIDVNSSSLAADISGEVSIIGYLIDIPTG